MYCDVFGFWGGNLTFRDLFVFLFFDYAVLWVTITFDSSDIRNSKGI